MGPRCGGRDFGGQKKEDKDEATWIEIPEDFIINAVESLIEHIVNETFPDFTTRKSDGAYLKEWAILTPRNDDADTINAYMFQKLSGPTMTYNNADEDTADHHRARTVCDLGLNPDRIKRRGDHPNTADHTYIHTNTIAFNNEMATMPYQSLLHHDNKQKTRAVA
ncbi:ATP-dependent DNA helicase PIF1-like protein [Tanacetum coccineum]